MADTKHTPGSWRAVIRSNQMGVRSVAVDMPPNGAWKPTKKDGFTETDVERAHLVAAAGVMLAALELVANGIRAGNIPDQSLVVGDENSESQDVVALSGIVNAAIAKARGNT